MEPSRQELTLEESIKQVMQTLPPPIRHYLGQGKYTEVAKGLMTKYGLHIDQATILEREIMLLLMGIEAPEEFTQALVTEARLDQQTVSGIVQEINVQIFMPLREEMMRGVVKVSPPVANPALPVSRPPSVAPSAAPRIVPATPAPAPQPVNAPVPNYAASLAEAVQAMGVVAPPPQSPKYFHLENKLPAPAASLSGGGSARPVPPVPTESTAPQPAKAQPQQSAPRPPASTIAPLPPRTVLPRTALGEVLAAVTRTPPEVSQGTAKTPTPPPQIETPLPPAPAKTAPPPENLPGAMPPPVFVPEVQPTPAIPPTEPPPAPPPPQPRPSTPSTPYSADPYREPIE